MNYPIYKIIGARKTTRKEAHRRWRIHGGGGGGGAAHHRGRPPDRGQGAGEAGVAGGRDAAGRVRRGLARWAR